MSTNILSAARISIPTDCFHLVAELIQRLGGSIERDEDNDVITVPPIPEAERRGRMVKGLRLRAGMTQKQLAEAIHVPQSHISEYEQNKRGIPAEKAELLAQVLNTVPTHFLPK